VRVAFVCDVHGNLPALEAVLADARAQGVDAIWDGGDVVGYHPWPSECVQRLNEVCDLAVQGNYDRKVLRTPRRRQRWLRRKDPLKADTLIWAWEHLDERSREILAARPPFWRAHAPCGDVLLLHASPLSRKEPLCATTGPARWTEQAVAAGGAALVLHGHVHIGHAHREEGLLFLTPGSVGRPEDGDPRAAYAIVDLKVEGPTYSVRRVAYDVDPVLHEIAARRLPREFAVMAARGFSLTDARRWLEVNPE
jgi:predicted phosphodiesterase